MSRKPIYRSEPPRWATRFLHWYCHAELVDEVEGDLYELFQRRVESQSLWKAKALYWLNVLMFLHPDYIRKRKSDYLLNHTTMFRNYYTIALRNLSKHKSFAIINIAGLTLGIAGALVIFLLVYFELSFDNFHPKEEQIYRVLSGSPKEVKDTGDTGTPTGLMPVLKSEFAEIAKVAAAYRLNPAQTQIEVNDQLTRESHIYFVTPSFFEIFNFPWKVGDPKKSLSQPGQVVISEDLAQKYFGGDAIGKRIKLNNEYDLMISGIIHNTPQNTDIPIQMAVSYATFQRSNNYQEEYVRDLNSNHHTYVLLHDGVDPASVEAKFHDLISKYLGEEIADEQLAHVLQPLSDIHYNEGINGNFSRRTISKETIFSLALIGVFLLVTACINFINLATARAVKRSKEVGMRKILGSTRRQMIGQFMSETLVLTLLATLLAYLLTTIIFPYLPNLLGIIIDASYLYQPLTLLMVFGLTLLVGILAGFYPALMLSRYRPLAALKNSLTDRQSGSLSLRRGLIIFQFMLSQALIICTIVVVSQMHYVNTTSLGFDKEAVVVVDLPEGDPQKLQTIRNNTTQYTAIDQVSFSLNTPAETTNKFWTTYTYETAPNEEKMAEQKFIDQDYLSLYDIPLLAGRNLREGDSIQILVNEAFLKDNGIQHPQDALGTVVDFAGLNTPTIVGVIKDFHSLSLQQEIPPLIMIRARFPPMFQTASFKIKMVQAPEAIASIEQQWKEAFPDYYFSYQFLEDDLATLYEKEQRTSRLLTLFAGLTIFIGCLGLYGLISFITAQKTKEIGIRKVLGATVQQIAYLFTKDFAALVVVAFVIAAPLGYFLMQQWLADFTYKITMSWWMFAVAAIAGILVAGITISFQSIKAAVANPVDALRDE